MEQTARISFIERPAGTEAYIAIDCPPGLSFENSAGAIMSDYSALLRKYGLGEETEVYLRFHLSDIANQSTALRRILRHRGGTAFYSLVGQPPASGGKLCMEAYHIKAAVPIRKVLSPDGTLTVGHGGYTSLWTKGSAAVPGTAEAETQVVLEGLSGLLRGQGGSLRANGLRTWFYIRDIDRNYRGFAAARAGFFSKEGMTEDSHTISSTGIEGLSEHADVIVGMDAFCLFGADAGQITYLHAPDHMCATHRYGVTFERATRIDYGDRSHFLISGTASIDPEGRVLHAGDLERQADRCLENIAALLAPQGAGLHDLKTINVYIRDFADSAGIRAFLDEHLPHHIPRIVVQGAICRREWLIEMDGVAATAADMSEFGPFC